MSFETGLVFICLHGFLVLGAVLYFFKYSLVGFSVDQKEMGASGARDGAERGCGSGGEQIEGKKYKTKGSYWVYVSQKGPVDGLGILDFMEDFE